MITPELRVTESREWRSSKYGPPSLNHADEDNYDREHQQDVNESAHGVGGGESQGPQDK